jgi:protein gp37
MALYSPIEWTEATWNPVTGCSHISAGCDHCYAERLAKRLQAMGMPKYRRGFEVATHDEDLLLPQSWRKSRMVFLCSMGDLFHADVPTGFIKRVFAVMSANPQHRFQVLTKRSKRLKAMRKLLPWPQNVWMGVTVEDARVARRVDELREVPAAVRFLSCEPLIGPVGRLNLRDIDWVIVGGESGPGARPMRKEWVLDVRRQCRAAQVPFFFKQWGGARKHLNGRELDGREYSEMPLAADRDIRRAASHPVLALD